MRLEGRKRDCQPQIAQQDLPADLEVGSQHHVLHWQDVRHPDVAEAILDLPRQLYDLGQALADSVQTRTYEVVGHGVLGGGELLGHLGQPARAAQNPIHRAIQQAVGDGEQDDLLQGLHLQGVDGSGAGDLLQPGPETLLLHRHAVALQVHSQLVTQGRRCELGRALQAAHQTAHVVGTQPVRLEQVHGPDNGRRFLFRARCLGTIESLGHIRWTLGPEHVQQCFDLLIAEELLHWIRKVVQKMSSTVAILSPLNPGKRL